MTKKPITPFLKTGSAIHAHRQLVCLNQTQYWGRIGVTQSAGSRYEAGRKIPRTVQNLLHLAYADKALAAALFKQLRNDGGSGESPQSDI